ncbi:MAG: hypothetical protein JW811_04020 [Clostridiales bacterium]|nr:hypothetical protein [Clostridiales bacterium]
MRVLVKAVDLTPEEIAATLDDPLESRLTLSILHAFIDRGLTYKTRTNWKPKHSGEPDSYRVFCYVRKSKEALIINTKHTDTKALLVQTRILNPSTFGRLDEYSENIRRQILHSSADCRHCEGCDKAYVFRYAGKPYRKCHMICNNFLLSVGNDDDVRSVMDIVNREIAFGTR